MALIKCQECGKEISTQAKACPHCGATPAVQSKKKPRSKLVMGLVGIAGLAAIGHIATLSSNPSPASKEPPVPAELVKITDIQASKQGFGSVMVVTVTLKNENPMPVKDFEIVCNHFAASGTTLNPTKAVLYERLEAGQTRTFKNVNFGFLPPQSAKYNCDVMLAKKA